jgi:hypothetical protein
MILNLLNSICKSNWGKKWVKSCLTINTLSTYCWFFHDNFNLDLNPLFSSELRIEAAASFNSQLLSHVFVRGCWKHQLLFCCRYCLPAMLRAVGISENPGVPVLFGGHNLPHLVEIGLTDLPKSVAPPAPPGTTGLMLLFPGTNPIKVPASWFHYYQRLNPGMN